MSIFISWSGNRSLAVAEALREWLPHVIQPIELWMSAEDIRKGSNWREKMFAALEVADGGIVCLTPENLDSPWIHYEAGAVAHATAEAHLWTYLFETTSSQVKNPLSIYQGTKADKAGTLRMVVDINDALGDKRVEPYLVEGAFELNWSDFAAKLTAIPAPEAGASPPEREESDKLDEVLEAVRGLVRDRPKSAGREMTSTDYEHERSLENVRRALSQAIIEVGGAEGRAGHREVVAMAATLGFLPAISRSVLRKMVGEGTLTREQTDGGVWYRFARIQR